MAFGRKVGKAGKIDLLGRAQEQQELARRYEEEHAQKVRERTQSVQCVILDRNRHPRK